MPVRSLNSSVFRWPDRTQVDEAVRGWAIEAAARHPETRRIGYFGSYARGDWGVGSDLDVVVVVSESSEPFERRSSRWDLAALPVPTDLLVYTEEEWRVLRQAGGRFSNMLGSEVVWVHP